MRASPLSAVAVVALLVFAGCSGLPGAGGNGGAPDASPDEFPNASAVDQSVFDTHATALANTSFTLAIEEIQKDRNPAVIEKNFTYRNHTSRFLAEPGASQYLLHISGHMGNGSTYSNGSTEYVLSRENDWTEVRRLSPVSVINESSDRYLWSGLFDNDSGNQLDHAAIDATFQREGVETFQGVPVMRYEATGVDALAGAWAGGENASSWYEEFSATLLLDEDGVVRYYEYCRENDLCLTHALIDPQIDRSKGSSFRTEDDVDRPGALRKVADADDGIVVSGARMLATLGPQADELLIFPFGHYGENEADEALAFAIPIEADGLRLICRPSLSPNDAGNHPLASRMDEMDTFVVFDEVFVPNDRLFVDADVEVANAWRDTAQPAFASHQTVTKDLVKAEFVFGVAVMLAESTGVDEYFHVQSKLGEIAEAANLLNAAVLAAERQATEYRDTGYVVPEYTTLNAALSSFADSYQRFVQILKDIGGSGLVGVPAWEDLDSAPPLGDDVETYFRGKEMAARERLGVQKLAADIAVSGFGGREELYERFHVGGPMRVKANQYKGYPDTEEIKARVRRFGLADVDASADGRDGGGDAE